MYSFDLTKRYVETMEIDDFLDLFPQSEVLRRLGNLCSCIICAAALSVQLHYLCSCII